MTALVTPSLLVWARERMGFRPTVVAEKLKISEERLLAWEAGQERPTVAQARRLADIYRRPLAIFYLPEPPDGFDVLREYRRLPGLEPGKESPELRFALRQADFRRQVAMDVAEELHESLPIFRGQARMSEDPEHVGKRLREFLGLTVEEQLSWTNVHTALTEWRRACEVHGVLVFQAPRIRVGEMRAVCIPLEPLPVVVLNSKDAVQGRIFSLLHELPHLWLIRGGHRVSDAERRRAPEDQPTEVFANAAAGAALLPAPTLLGDEQEIRRAVNAPLDDLRALKTLAYRYSVSAEVVARRLVTLGKMSARHYEALRQVLRTAGVAQATSKKDIAIPIQVKVVSQLGRFFTGLLLQGYQREVVTSSRLCDYLGVKFKYVPKIEGEVYGRPFGPPLGARTP